nr:immunoglobulin heavy chain junction region [Macaca mulatta]
CASSNRSPFDYW